MIMKKTSRLYHRVRLLYTVLAAVTGIRGDSNIGGVLEADLLGKR
jgi:hypothetical protein